MSVSLLETGTQPLRPLEDVVKDLSQLTGLPNTQINQQISNLDFNAFEFQGFTLVSPALADHLVDRWAESLKQQLRNGAPNGKAAAAPVAAPVAAPKAKAPTLIKPGIPAPGPSLLPIGKDGLPDIELKVPKDVFKLVSTRYDVAMRKVLPKDPDAQQAYLQHIANESEKGQEFLAQICIVLVKKYKGRVGKETAYNRMLEKAKTLLRSL